MIRFSLDKKSPVPFYRQVVDMVLAGISSGATTPGDQLPTIRQLAVALGVNPNTVVKAYSQLDALGVLDTQQGSGVYVRATPPKALSLEHRRQALEALCSDFVSRAQLLDISIEELIDHLERMNSGRTRAGGGREKACRRTWRGGSRMRVSSTVGGEGSCRTRWRNWSGSTCRGSFSG